jgi:hypothetical protein
MGIPRPHCGLPVSSESFLTRAPSFLTSTTSSNPSHSLHSLWPHNLHNIITCHQQSTRLLHVPATTATLIKPSPSQQRRAISRSITHARASSVTLYRPGLHRFDIRFLIIRGSFILNHSLSRRASGCGGVEEYVIQFSPIRHQHSPASSSRSTRHSAAGE